MILNLTDMSTEPLDRQITAQLLGRILSRDLGPGHELLPPRKLARRQHVNVRSVERAYAELEQEGVVRARADGVYEVLPLDADTEAALEHRRSPGPVGTVEWEAMEADLAAARRIQAGLLPRELPDEADISVAAYSQPSQAVGGDFYDVLRLDRDRIAVIVADAAGKGLPAALMISQIHGMLRSELNHGNDIATTLRHINEHLAEFSDGERYATLFIGVLDRETGVLEFANAGHNHPVLMRVDGSSEMLEAGGTLLGIFPGVPFVTRTVELRRGDMLFLYTDGLSEARNARDEEYGETRIMALLRRHRRGSARTLVETAVRDVHDFVGAMPQGDDQTCVVLRANERIAGHIR